MMRAFSTLALAISAGVAAAPAAAQSAAAVEEARDADPHAALALFREFLSHPNDAQHREDIARLIVWMAPQFEKRGFRTQRLPGPGSAMLFAERTVEGADRTALIYLQSDGQPVDPARWDQPSPWQAAVKARDGDGWRAVPWPKAGAAIDPDWRVFARSASDSKGPMTQFLLAIDALDRAGVAPAFNIKVFIDTEEELGSPHIAEIVAQNRALLAADFLLVFDGPPHASNEPTVMFGARGIATMTLTTWGPKTPQHSGHYGNFLPNPALALAQLLSSMKTKDGRVRIDGFYDGVKIPKEARKALAAVPDDEAAILAALGLAAADKVAPTLQEALQYPSLNIRGFASGWVGAQARTIIPDRATAELDIRTVKETDPARLVALVRGHVEKEGFLVLDREPTDAERRAHARIATVTHDISYGAFRSDFDSEAGIVARTALRALYGEEPILVRTLGGSIPIAPMIEVLGIPAAAVPTVNIDNNQHSPNENIRVGNFLEGVAMLAAVLTTPAP